MKIPAICMSAEDVGGIFTPENVMAGVFAQFEVTERYPGIKEGGKINICKKKF